MPASCSVWRKSSAACRALAASGYRALLWQLKVIIGMPRSSNFFFQARAFAGSATNSGRGQCGDPLGPAAPTSTASMPRLTNLSSISSVESLLKGGSKTPMGKLFFGTAGLSTAADCAEADPESGADTNAAAVVPRNCRRFMKHPQNHGNQTISTSRARRLRRSTGRSRRSIRCWPENEPRRRFPRACPYGASGFCPSCS